MLALEQKIDVLGLGLTIGAEFETPSVQIQTHIQELHPDETAILSIQMEEQGPIFLRSLQLSGVLKTVDAHGVYFGADPGLELGYLPHAALEKDVAAHRGVPLFSLVTKCGNNRITIGFLGQHLETHLEAQLSELDASYHIRFSRPIETSFDGQKTVTELPGGHKEQIFVDVSNRPFSDVLAEYSELAKKASGVISVKSPDAAYLPAFCTWTAVHHDISQEWILETAKMARDLGFGTWITDDGWHHDNGEFGNYDDVGAWRPSLNKFPDFHGHVKEVQKLGLSYLLWVAPFMVGTSYPGIDRNKHKLLPGHPNANFDLLDPFDSATDGHVRNLLQGLLTEFELDGLKIDFIDAVAARKAKPEQLGSVGQTISEILRAALSPMQAKRPDYIFEFRNGYANLAMREFGNLYRSSDLPVNFTLNRWQATMLRLLNPDVAVVTDPMLWHPEDSEQNVAIHLINGISAVPMVSIDLLRYPNTHLKVIKNWIGYYRDNVQTLCRGTFAPRLRGSHIPLAVFGSETKQIVGLYEDVMCPSFADDFDILNASSLNEVVFEKPLVADFSYRLLDLFGNPIGSGTIKSGSTRLTVPIGGRAELLRSK